MALTANRQGIEVLSDVVINDSDKSLTIESGRDNRILYGVVHFTSTADAGNRQLEFRVKDGAGAEMYVISGGAVQVASKVYDYLLTPGGIRETTIVNNELVVPLPIDTVLLSGWSLQVIDSAVIQAAADDMTMYLVVEGL